MVWCGGGGGGGGVVCLFPDGTRLDGSLWLCVAGTNDGAVAVITTLDEVTFKRLLGLQKLMNFVLPHFGGLNPKGFRLFSSPESRVVGRSKNVVDGDLIWRYPRASGNRCRFCAHRARFSWRHA